MTAPLQTATPTGGMLRVLACGSVDDGKSTLIGRLLFEFGAIPDDVMDALVRDSRRFGTTGDAPDYALLVDGLAAEREQGVTIDLAYRHFTTPRRRYLLADAPGHEQYTRNMVTGASLADAAVLLVDARKGILRQTRRHAALAARMGVRQVLLVVNKMDLVAFRQEPFDAMAAEFAALGERLGITTLRCIPVCARDGDNVLRPGERMPWYRGPALLEALEACEPTAVAVSAPARLPVQIVLRPDAGSRFYAGTLAAGCLAVGDTLVNVASGEEAGLRRIVLPSGDAERAEAGDAVSLALDREIDVSRGDVLACAPLPLSADRLSASLIWMGEAPLVAGRAFTLALGAARVTGTVTAVHARLDIDTFEEVATETLGCHEIGRVEISLVQQLVCAPYRESRDLGGFLLLDRLGGTTLAAGLVEEAVSTRRNLRWQTLDVTPELRARLKGQKPVVLWFTGLPASGKSTIANLVERRLAALGRHTMLLDGDNVRHGLSRDLGFSEAERVENIRRVAEVANLFADAGLIVICAFISPYRNDRALARHVVGSGRFLEVFVDTPLDECRRRDPKGHYAKAAAGQLANFTGIDAPYEAPLAADLCLGTLEFEADALAEDVVADLRRREIF
jgi:bifunctional enzyme CysN/CysC